MRTKSFLLMLEIDPDPDPDPVGRYTGSLLRPLALFLSVEVCKGIFCALPELLWGMLRVGRIDDAEAELVNVL